MAAIKVRGWREIGNSADWQSVRRLLIRRNAEQSRERDERAVRVLAR